MRNSVNFSQKNKRWPWVTMDDHGPTLENCSTLCSLAASHFHKLHILPHQPPLRQVLAKMIQSLSMQELPTFLSLAGIGPSSQVGMPQHFPSEKDCFDASWALANNPNANWGGGDCLESHLYMQIPHKLFTNKYRTIYLDIFRMGRMTRNNEGLPNPGQSHRERCCSFWCSD